MNFENISGEGNAGWVWDCLANHRISLNANVYNAFEIDSVPG